MNSTANTETLADIVREMRNPPRDGRDDCYCPNCGDYIDGVLRLWADRIEAAAEQERAHQEALRINECIVSREEAASEWQKRIGNSAALREALEKFLDLARRGLAFVTSYRYTEEENDELEEAFANAKSALAKPARNCDVWSADEQAERFLAECKRHDHCTTCPVHAMWGVWRVGQPKSCKFIWAQMPFVPAEGGAE